MMFSFFSDVLLAVSRCVAGENKVASFGLIVAGEAGIHQGLVAGFAVFEMSESPAACRGILFRVLNHELNVRGGSRNERLGSAEDLVVFLRWHVTVMQSGNDCAVREWELPVAIGMDRDIVTQHGCKAVEVALFVSYRDQPPLAVSGRNLGYEDRGGLVMGVYCEPRKGDNPGECYNWNQQESDPFHMVLFSQDRISVQDVSTGDRNIMSMLEGPDLRRPFFQRAGLT